MLIGDAPGHRPAPLDGSGGRVEGLADHVEGLVEQVVRHGEWREEPQHVAVGPCGEGHHPPCVAVRRDRADADGIRGSPVRADDLDLPRAVGVVGETVSSGIPDGDTYGLLASWDAVLGLDLERIAEIINAESPDVVELWDYFSEGEGARAGVDALRSA